jgi:hypothetical protein
MALPGRSLQEMRVLVMRKEFERFTFREGEQDLRALCCCNSCGFIITVYIASRSSSSL